MAVWGDRLASKHSGASQESGACSLRRHSPCPGHIAGYRQGQSLQEERKGPTMMICILDKSRNIDALSKSGMTKTSHKLG